jgi:cyclohexyl-isocyanide hydratase
LRSRSSNKLNIVFILFDNVTQLDFSGPVQFLSRLPGTKTHVVSKDGNSISTDCGFGIEPTGSFANCPQADILCMPGGHGVREAIGDAAIVEFVKAQAKAATWITSVCTGSFILGAAGLLKGKRATTHWAYTQLLPLFGATHEEARVVRDGNLVTAGGVTSGIDFALELMALAQGEDVARSVQLALEYDPAPPFAAGHPSRAPQPIIDGLRARVYDKAAADMETAIRAIG